MATPRRNFRLAIALALATIGAPIGLAQRPPSLVDLQPTLNAGRTPPKEVLPTLRSELRDLIPTGDSSRIYTLPSTPLGQNDGRIPVSIRCGDTASVLAALSAMQREPANVLSEIVEVYLNRDEILEIASHSAVLSVELINPPEPQVLSQGRSVHNAAAWIAGGYIGTGVKVGIIDIGFLGVQALIGTELPPITGRCYYAIGAFTSNLSDCAYTTDHGTAVAESLVDVAPGVTLYIANPISPADLQNTVNWMVGQGVKVINYSVTWTWDGPGDGTSPLPNSPLKSVDSAVSGGITFVVSAGNQARKTWYGNWSDVDADNFHEFAPGSEVNLVTMAAGSKVTAEIRWSDSWSGPTRDIDLYLLDSALNQVASSTSVQSGLLGQTPTEWLTYVAPNSGQYLIVIKRYSGSTPTWIQLRAIAAPSDFQFFTSSGSIGNPAETANTGALAVGAAAWDSTTTIENFSSQGPTPDGRIKPDIVGADKADTATYGAGAFAGTSQASPHVAGLAALVAGAFPSYTPQQIAGYLKQFALPRGGVPNNTWGYGFAYLPDLCSYKVDPININSSSTGGGTSVTVTASTGCSWTATSNASWLHITAGAPGNGNGTVSISVDPNQGAQRVGTLTVAGTTVTVTQVGGSAPTISDVADVTILEDASTAPIQFTVADAESSASSLVVTAISSNAALVPPGAITLSGSGGARTVSLTPLANQNGVTTITLTVSDGTLLASDSFVLTVTAVNDAPTISAIASQTAVAGGLVGPLSFTVADIDTAAASLAVSTITSNPLVVPMAGLSVSGSGSSRTVSVASATGTVGVAEITLTVSDGSLTASTAFTVTTIHSSPQGLAATVDGALAQLSWTAPATGGTPSGYQLEVGTSPGAPGTTIILGAVLQTDLTTLTPGTWFARLRATGATGAGLVSNEVAFSVTAAPSRPRNLSVSVNGNNVSFVWEAPAAGVVSGYALEAGTASGLANLIVLPLGPVTSFSGAAPNGVFFVRVRANGPGGLGSVSNEVTFAAGPVVPGPPSGLTATVVGNAVSLSWVPPASGGTPSGYVIEAGSVSGASNVATIPVGGTAFSGGGVPTGTYFVRVRAANGAGTGPPSNEVSFTVGSPVTLPSPPIGLTATVSGSTVTLNWQPPTSGGAPTNYTIQAGSASGLSNLAVLPIGGALTFSAIGVPTGIYYVRVVSSNAAGVSGPSNEVVVVVS